MSYIVYKTTNKINNKFYIGVHDLNTTYRPDYIGSGLMLSRAIKKYGKENFIRETLMEFDTKEEAYDYEAWLVNDYMINRPDCYNIALGGKGGVGSINKGIKYSPERLVKHKETIQDYYNSPEGQLKKKEMSDIKNVFWESEDGIELRRKYSVMIINRDQSIKDKSSETQKAMYKTEAGTIRKEKARKHMIKQWSDPSYVEHIKQTQIDFWASDAGHRMKERYSRESKNRPISQETRRKMKETQSKLPKVPCPYCSVEGKKANMIRWHFDNCKNKG